MSIFTKHKICTKKSVGKILAKARKKQDITLEKAELDTKVRMKYLQALESDSYANMPADVYNIGFLARYCDYLKINSAKIIFQYRQERELYEKFSNKQGLFSTKKPSSINPGNPENYRERLKFVFTPQTIVSAVVILITIGIISYIWLQVTSFAAAPQLELKNPSQQIMVSSETVSIEGNTDPTVELLINNQSVALDANGHFQEDVQLVNGMNNIEIKAKNKAGKETVKTIQVLATENK